MEARLLEHLDRRRRDGNLRSLMPLPSDATLQKENKPLVDFASNDYLGLARCTDQHHSVQAAYDTHLASQSKSLPLLGATGSRLLSGDSTLARSLELNLARTHNRQASLLFNSGYDANLSVLSSLPYKDGDAIVMDELVHNSLVMGVRMGRLNSNRVFLFKHNDVHDLKRVMDTFQQQFMQQVSILVVVESVYSMDGDIAPLKEILDVCQQSGAAVMVDEAHGLGVYGRTNVQDMYLDLPDDSEKDVDTTTTHTCDASKVNNKSGGGTGVLAALNLEHHLSLFCSIHTFGKAAGCHGAVVAGSNTLVSYLVNYARPFVYSTALPLHSLISIQQSYKAMMGTNGEKRRERVFQWVKLFRKEISHGLSTLHVSNRGVKLLPSPSPIQALIVPGNNDCIEVCKCLREVGGFNVYPIRSPTVPKGEERIRIILHSHNSEDEIRMLVKMVLVSIERCYARSKL